MTTKIIAAFADAVAANRQTIQDFCREHNLKFVPFDQAMKGDRDFTPEAEDAIHVYLFGVEE